MSRRNDDNREHQDGSMGYERDNNREYEDGNVGYERDGGSRRQCADKRNNDKRRKRHTSPVGAFIFTFMLVILAFLLFLVISGKGTLGKNVRHKTTEAVIEKAIGAAAGTDISIEEEKSKMTAEDAQKVDDMIDKYGTNENVSKAVQAYRDGGSTSAVEEELKDQIDPEDIETAKELYEKYNTQ